MKRKSVLVTGAAGFIASHIVDEFIRHDFTVIGVDSLAAGNRNNLHQKCEFVQIDLNNQSAVKKLLRQSRPDTIIHQASNLVDVELSIAHPALAYRDLIMTTNILEEAKFHGLSQILFSSSANVYGNQKKGSIKESFPLNPSSPYGITKISIENYIRYFATRYALTYTIFRYFNVYGERQNTKAGAAIPTFIKQVLNDLPVTVSGGGQVRDFVYVKDVARANLVAANTRKNGIFNVGSGKTISISEVVKLIEKITGKSATIRYTDSDPADVKFSQASITKIKQDLGWSPEVSFKDGLANTIKYYQQHLEHETHPG